MCLLGTSAKLCGAVAKQLRNRTYIISLSALVRESHPFRVLCSVLCWVYENRARYQKPSWCFFLCILPVISVMVSIWSSVFVCCNTEKHTGVEFEGETKSQKTKIYIYIRWIWIFTTQWTWSEESTIDFLKVLTSLFSVCVFFFCFCFDKLAKKQPTSHEIFKI